MAKIEVATRGGLVAGEWTGGIKRWLGIRYAEADRFRAPRPVEPWRGVRAATALAPQCPQHFFGKAKRARIAPPGFDEDCLALNIWVPEGGAATKPVLVWIHGGAFVVGASDIYNGAELAAIGDMVVVAINYRLGVLGFVNFGGALGDEAVPSNLGLRDQIAALEWVRDNIAEFGGDPARVTIAGESAGSMSVSLLMLAPAARGLFHGAIMQSGAISLIHDRAKSVAIARRYLDRLHVDGVAALRALDLPALFAAQAEVGAGERRGIPAAPWYDGDLLPASLEAARAHDAAPVPLMAGAMREETRLFEIMPGDTLPLKRDDLVAILRANLPAERVAGLLAAYPATRKGTRALATDLTFAMPTRHFAERQAAIAPTWAYRFDYAHPLLGAFHALDMMFEWPMHGVVPTLLRGGPLTGRRAALARRFKGAIAHFVAHGAPPADWPAYDARTRRVRLFGATDRIAADPDADRRAAWAGADVAPRV